MSWVRKITREIGRSASGPINMLKKNIFLEHKRFELHTHHSSDCPTDNAGEKVKFF